MKPIGLIGGLTYVSTIEYYRVLNELANKKLGGSATAEIIMYSVNFEEIKILTEKYDWEKLALIISGLARKIEAAGASCLLIGANTMHKIAGEIQNAINIPVIHIADAVGKSIKSREITKVALLGTRYTMQLGFYQEKLSNYGIETIVPTGDDAEFINWTIYNEFSKNIFSPETKSRYQEIIDDLSRQGVDGVILGCTEIPLLIKQEDCSLPLFDTAKIHSQAGVDFAIQSILV